MALKRLEAHHLLAIQYLSQPRKSGMTDEQIATECGVTRQSIYNWRKDPLFERELKKQIVRNTQDRLPELMTAMIDHAIAEGNAAAAKLILTANDMLTDKVEVKNVGEAEAIDKDALKERIEKLKKEADNKADKTSAGCKDSE